MFNDHSLTVVDNLGIIGPEINNIDFVSVAAITTSEYPQLPNIYNAAILTPPTEVLMAWADGQPLVMQNEYPKWLLSKDADEMIVALIGALTKKNIILYIPRDEFNIFGNILLSHIYYTYGITCNTPTSQFSVNYSKIPFIISKFFIMDMMTPEDYLEAYPALTALPPWVINKLAMQLRPFDDRQATFDEYYNYFNNLNASKMPKKNINEMVRIVEVGGSK